MHQKGEFVTLNGRTGIVVLTGTELGEGLIDHIGIWFGDMENNRPVLWTIPSDYLVKSSPPVLKH
jgi:hypothetical protein